MPAATPCQRGGGGGVAVAVAVDVAAAVVVVADDDDDDDDDDAVAGRADIAAVCANICANGGSIGRFNCVPAGNACFNACSLRCRRCCSRCAAVDGRDGEEV